jgi:hypothetical protein
MQEKSQFDGCRENRFAMGCPDIMQCFVPKKQINAGFSGLHEIYSQFFIAGIPAKIYVPHQNIYG